MTKTHYFCGLVLALAFGVVGLSACGSNEPTAPSGLSAEELGDLVPLDEDKDTGYLGNLAAELSGEFEGQVRVPAIGDAMDLLQDAQKRESLIDDQLRYAKNQLNAETLHLNLSGGDFQNVDAKLEGDEIVITYNVMTETIVTYDELEEANITDVTQLENQVYRVKLPADPRDITEQYGERCTEGADDSLADFNYFYYFTPDKAGCDMPIVDATFSIRNLLPSAETYPEYDRLGADGKLTVAVFYGAAGHDPEVSTWDWGAREHRDFIRALERRGYSEDGVADQDSGKGQRFTKTIEGLEVIVDVISPMDLAALKNDSDGLFGRLVRTHEFIAYNGHSFYGSLDVLDDPANFAQGEYQIFFMNSCWSYEYYTKQIFEAKASAADPRGWADADVINDTESGWFHNMTEFTTMVLTNLVMGTVNEGRDADGRDYSWGEIITSMNDFAQEAQDRTSTKSHEIMGVSGVRDNRFHPDGNGVECNAHDQCGANQECVDNACEDVLPCGGTGCVGNVEQMPYSLESEHPYANDTERYFDIDAGPDVTSFQIHFAKIGLETDYDTLQVFDAQGVLVAEYTGQIEDVLTAEIPGNTASMRFSTDYSITDYGFEIDRLDVRTAR